MKILIALFIAVICSVTANAQSSGAPSSGGQGAADTPKLVTQKSLSLPIAKTIAEAALAACQAKGYHTSVAVVDRGGQVLVILRDEQATTQTAEMARRKAYTARMFRMNTSDFQKRSLDPSYAPQRDLPDVLALGGGVPIQLGNEAIGGVGSAGSTQDQDEACAKAGIDKVGALLK